MGILIKGMDEIPEDGAVLVVKHDNGKAYIKHACTYGYSMELVKLPAVQPDHVADTGKKVSIPCAHENDVIFRKAAIDAIHGRTFKEIVVRYPTYTTHPEHKGKPYFLIKYTENGQEFIGYGTYKPEVLSEYLKEDFMPSAQPNLQPTCNQLTTDTISRQAAIDALDEQIENMPSAAPSTAHTTETTAPSTDDWIPVERELPEDLAEVNVTWVNHEPEPYYEPIKSKPFTASAVYYEGNWYWYSSVCADVLAEYGRNDVDKVDDAIEITAWRPLPEPYRGGDSNE